MSNKKNDVNLRLKRMDLESILDNPVSNVSIVVKVSCNRSCSVSSKYGTSTRSSY